MGFFNDLISNTHKLNLSGNERFNPFNSNNWNTTDLVWHAFAPGVKQSLDHLGDLYDLMFPLPDTPSTSGIESTQNSQIAYIPVIYGTRSVAGTRVFYHATGGTNEYLHQVFCLCEGEIDSLVDVYVNDVSYTDPKFDGLIDVYLNTGKSDETAFSELVAAAPSRWTTAHKGNDTASIYIRCKFDDTVFSGGFPSFKFILKGKKIYDFRNEVTSYSENPSLVTYDYLTSTRYGKGLDATLLNIGEFGSVADYSETQVQAYTGGPYINLFAINGPILPNDPILDNLKSLLACFRGKLVFTGGQYSLRCLRPASATFELNEDNIVGGWNFSSASKRTLKNTVKAEYVAADQKYIQDYATVSSSTYLAEDNGAELLAETSYNFETSFYRAAHKCETLLKMSRNGISVSVTAFISAMQCEVGDIVSLTHPTPGWENKLFRITQLTIHPDCNVSISLVEHDDDIYDWSINAEHTFPADTTLPDAFASTPPTNLTLVSGDGELQIPSDGTVISRVKATWTAPTGCYVAGYIFEYRQSGTVDWTAVDVGNVTTAWISPVKDLEYYDVRVRTYNLSQINSDYVVIYGHQALGKSAPPPDVLNFSVVRQPDGTRQFDWEISSVPADLAGYKLRYKLSVGQTWDNMVDLTNGLLLSAPFETNQLAAGTYTLAIKAVDTSGNESVNAKYIESTLGDPRIAASIYSENPLSYGWLGTKTDCFVADDSYLYAISGDDWDDLSTTVGDWDSWNSYAGTPATPITYEHTTIDLGAILTYIPLVTVTGNGTLSVEEQHSDDDITYSSWTTIGSQITARYIRFRVTCTQTTGTPSITSMFINLSAEKLSEIINDLDSSTLATCTPSPSCSTSGFSIAAGDFRIPITKTYDIITMVRLSLQNVGAGWTWEIVDKDTAVGPRVKIYNSSSTLADATIDVEVTGV